VSPATRYTTAGLQAPYRRRLGGLQRCRAEPATPSEVAALVCAHTGLLRVTVSGGCHDTEAVTTQRPRTQAKPPRDGRGLLNPHHPSAWDLITNLHQSCIPFCKPVSHATPSSFAQAGCRQPGPLLHLGQGTCGEGRGHSPCPAKPQLPGLNPRGACCYQYLPASLAALASGPGEGGWPVAAIELGGDEGQLFWSEVMCCRRTGNASSPEAPALLAPPLRALPQLLHGAGAQGAAVSPSWWVGIPRSKTRL